MKSVGYKIILVGFLMLLSACAHYPSQYSSYSTSNAYYPGNRGYPQRYTQYNNYYPSRPLPSYSPSYYGYSRPYGGSYQSNSYYYQNNNVYNPPRLSTPLNYGHDHHDHHRYAPSSGYGYPHSSGWDNRRDGHDHHSNWNGDHHGNDRHQPQPITIRNVDKNYIHIDNDNRLNNRGNNQHSSNWAGGHNNNQAQPRIQNIPTYHDNNHDRPRDNTPNFGWGNRRNDHQPNQNQWVGGQTRNDQPVTRQQINFSSHGGQHAVARDDGRQRNGEGNHGNNPHEKKDAKGRFGR